MSLRNELREPTDNATADATYNWQTWYNNTISGAEGIYAANPSPLIFFSGLGYDTDLSAPVDGTDLGNGVYFNKSSLDFGDKLVWELHNYENSATDCSSIQSTLYNGGYKAMNLSDPTVGDGNYGPVVLTEFGFAQDAADYSGVYAQCLKDWLEDWKGGWMAWVLAGGYYIRSGVQDVEDTWGKQLTQSFQFLTLSSILCHGLIVFESLPFSSLLSFKFVLLCVSQLSTGDKIASRPCSISSCSKHFACP